MVAAAVVVVVRVAVTETIDVRVLVVKIVLRITKVDWRVLIIVELMVLRPGQQ